MYFRLKKTRSTTVLQLVRSYRDSEGNPRQKIVLSLGNADIPKELWKNIAVEIENQLNDIPTLFKPKRAVAEWAEKIIRELQLKEAIPGAEEIPKKVSVSPENVSVENVRELGPELVAKEAWDSLAMDEILENAGLTPIQRRDAALSTINRLCEPVSEHALPDWINTTALEDLFHTRLSEVGHDRFYRVSDVLLKAKESIEEKLSIKEEGLFNLDRSIYLYDLTNTYFEGVMDGNDYAKRGHSKEKRTDAPLISLGMVLDRDGFVVQHKIHAGNVGEAGTLEHVVEDLAGKWEKKPLILMDSGISSKENLNMLKKHGFDYITVGKRPSRLAYKAEFEDLTQFRTITNSSGQNIRIKTIENEEEKLVACLSEAREKKERAIISKSEEKYLEALEKLKKSVAKGTIKDREKIDKKMGRLEEKHSRIARYYDVVHDEKSKSLSWERKEAAYEEAIDMSGGYILKSSRKDLSDKEIWHLYIMLTRVETGFRTLKSELGLRPIYHQKKERSEGHIFLTILAYHLLHWIETTLRIKGKTMSWRAVRRALQTHSYTTIVLPTEEHGVIRLRKPSTPDTRQKEIYELLGISHEKLPIRRLKKTN